MIPLQVAETFDEIITEKVITYWETLVESIPRIIIATVIFTIGYFLARVISKVLHKQILEKTGDPLMSKFLGSASRLIIMIITFMVSLYIIGLGSIAAGLLTAAGASAVIIGFAFKDIGENFIAGVILAFNRPFEVMDTVKIGDNFGKVKALDFRYTKLKTFDGKDVYIPNADVLTTPVMNYTEDGFFRWDVGIGIAYEDNIEEAKAVVIRVLDEEPNVISDTEHKHFVIEEALATSTVNLRVFFWVDTYDFRMDALITKGNVVRKLKEALGDAGFYMPADIHEIKLYGAETGIPIEIVESENKKLTEKRNKQ